jgi:hypothetical protein
VTVQFHSNLNLKRGGFDVVKMLPKTWNCFCKSFLVTFLSTFWSPKASGK